MPNPTQAEATIALFDELKAIALRDDRNDMVERLDGIMSALSAGDITQEEADAAVQAIADVLKPASEQEGSANG